MNKAEFISMVAEQTGFTKADSEKATNAVLHCITEAMKDGGVTFVGFGTFTTSERAARNGRNPQTGETIKIAAATVPVFRAGKALKDSVNTKGKKDKK